MQIRNPFDDYDWAQRAQQGHSPMGTCVFIIMLGGILAGM